MKTLLKIATWIVGIFILLLIIAGIVFKSTFNPNDYKKQISQAVYKKTGHELKINGNIGLSIFPWLGVDISKVSFGNPKGFSGPELASIGEAQVHIQMLPMVFGDFKISKIILKDANFNVLTKQNGQSNWKDLTEGKTKAKKQASNKNKIAEKSHDTTSSHHDLPNFEIGSVNIENANVNIVNQQRNEAFHFNNFNLKSSDINFNGDAFNLSMNFALKQNNPTLAFTTSLQGKFSIDNDGISIENFNLSGKINAYKKRFKTPLPYAVEFDKLNAKNKARFNLKDFIFELANFKANASLSAKPHNINGQININNFNPSKLVSALGLEKQYQSAMKLKSASFNSEISTDDHIVSIKPLTLTLNGNSVNGTAKLNTQSQNLNFVITGNKLDLDSLMPTKSKTPASAKSAANSQAATASKSPGDLPINMLRKVSWNGRIDINSLKVAGLSLHQFSFKTADRQGHVSLGPISAKLYNGTLNSNSTLNASVSPARLTSQSALNHIELGPLTQDMAHKQIISGTAQMSLNLRSFGNSSKELTANLAGTGRFNVGKGKLHGFDLNSLVSQAKKFLSQHKGQQSNTPKAKTGNETDFSSINANFNIQKGVIYNNDLLLLTPYAQANGKGAINLKSSWINYQLSAGPLANGGKQAWYFPIMIQGPLAKPSIKVNMAALLGQVVQDALGNLVKDALGGKNHNQQQQKSNGQQLKGLFNSLFKH